MQETINFILNAAPPVVLLLALNGLGWVLKQIPQVPNWLIPAILPFAGAVLYPYVGEWSPTVKAARSPTVLMCLYGFGIGWAATGAYEAIRGVLNRAPGQSTTPPNTGTPPTTPNP